MGEITKAVGQWVVQNIGWTIIIFIFILQGLFKITKREIDPLGWIIGWIGKAFTKDVRNDVKTLGDNTEEKFKEIKKDRAEKIEELKKDYNDKITSLRADLDAFEETTNANITEMQTGTHSNCMILQQRLDAMEKSNDMQTIRQIKAHVLDFANSCMNGRKHTFRDFRNIIKENKIYEGLVTKYNLENDVYKDDFEFIMEIYHDCKKNRSFLNDNGQPYEEDEDE